MYEDTIKKMSLEEKIAFCSGADFWHTKEMHKYGIPSIMVCDGPHGLRKQTPDSGYDLGQSEPATCFPTAASLASTWNEALVHEVGEAIGTEAQAADIQMVLGPGVNMKRNPLCGRNFEYYSEDPYLTGKIGVSWVKGVQSKGVGTCLKHFAVNNQESCRMVSDSIVDERTLHEYYLPAFETIVKEAQPTAVMASYNKLNGVYACDNKKLLTEILREQWEFKGLVISDWMAEPDRCRGFLAGMDLEMPGSKGTFDKIVREAVVNGKIQEKDIDSCVERILELVFSLSSKQQKKRSVEEKKQMYRKHNALARKAAAEGAVLLKNESGILPLRPDKKVAVIGALAKEARIQGSGSSCVNAIEITSMIDELTKKQIPFHYLKGYELSGKRNDFLKIQAIEAAQEYDTLIVVAGLTNDNDMEGTDRSHLRLPGNQLELLKRLSRVSKNIIVVCIGGGVIELPWLTKVKALLHMHLAGQAFGGAAVDLLYGFQSPSGKLAETYPIKYEDVPSSDLFGRCQRQAEYWEGIYVGYRYYEKAGIPVRFPFGFGLSYAAFSYSNLKVESCRSGVKVVFTVKNISDVAGAEVVQVYVGDRTEGIHRPVKELKGFQKLFLKPLEEKEVSFILNRRAFAYYNVEEGKWLVPRGIYEILMGSSSEDIRLTAEVRGGKVKAVEDKSASWYYRPIGKPMLQDFESIYGKKIKPFSVEKPGEYTWNNSLMELQETSKVCRFVIGVVERVIAKEMKIKVDYKNRDFRMLMRYACNEPLRSLCLQMPDRISESYVKSLIDFANGKAMKGVKRLKRKKRKNVQLYKNP